MSVHRGDNIYHYGRLTVRTRYSTRRLRDLLDSDTIELGWSDFERSIFPIPTNKRQ